MQHDIVTRVLGVQQVPSRDGKSIRHEVSLQGGTAEDGTQYPPNAYVTFRPELSTKAFSLQSNAEGLPLASARVEIKQVPKRDGSGFFTNYELHDIAPQGMLAPMAMPAMGGTPAMPMQPPPMPQPQAQPMAPPPPLPAPQAQAPTQVHPALAQDEQRRSEEQRGFASNTVFGFVGALAQAGLVSSSHEAVQMAIQLTDDLVGFRATGSWNGAQIASAGLETQQPATPEELAQAANEELGEPAVTVGPGVPFETGAQPE